MNFSRFQMLFLVGLFFWGVGHPFLALCGENRPLEILTFSYPPYMEEDGTGLLPRMIREGAGDSLPEVVFQVYPRKRVLQMFHSEGKGDLLFLGESRYFPELEGSILAEAILKAKMVMVYRRAAFPDFRASGLEDFKGYRIATSLGSNFSELFRAVGMVVEESRMENNLRKLKAGRVDFWHTVDITALEMMEKEFQGVDKGFAVWEHKPLLVIELVSRKEGPAAVFLETFGRAFREFRAKDGDLRILEDFYGKGRVPAEVRIP
jgi:hypothetical protein